MLRAHPHVDAIWLYGSRAMGRHTPASDIDLTLGGDRLSHNDLLQLLADIDDLLLPWQVDLSLRQTLSEDLQAHVGRVGQCLWTRTAAIHGSPHPWLTPMPLADTPDLGPGLDPATLLEGLQRLAARPDVHALVVFGSRASGHARSDSDLDLLVIEREPSIAPERQLPLWQELRSALGNVGVPVDLLVYGQQEAAKLSGSRWHVLGHAARHGRVLYVAE